LMSSEVSPRMVFPKARSGDNGSTVNDIRYLLKLLFLRSRIVPPGMVARNETIPRGAASARSGDSLPPPGRRVRTGSPNGKLRHEDQYR
jgi:hypothetical protein